MKKHVNVIVGTNPNYSSPLAPELFFEVMLAGPATSPGQEFKTLERQGRSVQIMKRASFATVPGAASVMVWDGALVKIPRLKHDLSVAGMEAWHDLVATAQQAHTLAMRLDQTFEPGMVVEPGEIKQAGLREIIQANHKIKVEAPQFLAGGDALAGGDKDGDTPKDSKGAPLADIFGLFRGPDAKTCAACPDRDACLASKQ